MAQLLDEVTDVQAETLLSVNDKVMTALLGLVGTALQSATFPLDLTATDASRYCVQMTMAGPGIWPEITYKYDPFNLGQRRFLFPVEISVSDASGAHVQVTIVSDVVGGKISLIKHDDAQLVH